MKYQPQHEVPYEEEKRNQSLQKFYLASFHNKYMKEYLELQSTNLQKVCLHSPPIHNLQGEIYKHKILMYEENPFETGNKFKN